MAGRLRRWFALSWRDRRRVLGMMLFGLPAIHAGLRLFGYGRTRRWLERWSTRAGNRNPHGRDLDEARNLARLAAIAGRRGPVTATCLRQSLLVYWSLRRRGLDPRLQIGVRKNGAALDAHAWVELQGESLDPHPTSHTAFPSPPGEKQATDGTI